MVREKNKTKGDQWHWETTQKLCIYSCLFTYSFIYVLIYLYLLFNLLYCTVGSFDSHGKYVDIRFVLPRLNTE
jgi:hypothetical protein